MAFRTKSKDRETKRLRRHRRIRRTVIGTAARPRLVVHRSLKNMQGQLTDDVSGRVILGVTTIAPELGELRASDEGTKSVLARAAGKLLAEKAKAAGITRS